MSLGEWNGFDWDGLGPVAAAAALLVLALLPDRPPPTPVSSDDRVAALEAVPAGQAMPWRDRTSGLSGQVIPNAVFRGDNGLWCRHYKVSYGVGVQPSTNGLACRLTDGRWRDLSGGVVRASGQLAAVPER